MATQLYLTHCCAVAEVHGLSNWVGDPHHALRDIVDGILEGVPDSNGALRKPAMVVFTGVIMHHVGRPYTYGPQFAAFIEEHHLGTVVAIPPVANLNTGNTVQLWVWTVDRAAVTAWAEHNTTKLA